ncbi:MAG: hypothetical protein AAGD01_04870 [Acidobacteriota bacterium]
MTSSTVEKHEEHDTPLPPERKPQRAGAVRISIAFALGLLLGLLLGWFLFSPKTEPQDADSRVVDRLVQAMLEQSGPEEEHTFLLTRILNDEGQPTQLGDSLRDALRERLIAAHPHVSVVVRDDLQLAQLIDERKRQRGTWFQDIGDHESLSGATAVVSGELRGLREAVEISLQIVDIRTGKTLAAATRRLPRNDRINSALITELRPTRGSGSTWKITTVQADETALASNYYFQLVDCQLSAQTVFCNFKIKNEGNPRKLSVYKTSKVVPVDSDAVKAIGFEVDGQRRRKVEVSMEPGQKLELRVHFIGVPPETTLLSEVQLSCFPFRVSFLRVPVQRLAP